MLRKLKDKGGIIWTILSIVPIATILRLFNIYAIIYILIIYFISKGIETRIKEEERIKTLKKKKRKIIYDYLGDIAGKSYLNDKGQKHGLYIGYHFLGKVTYKTNYFNDVEYGLETWYNSNGEIDKQKYYL